MPMLTRSGSFERRRKKALATSPFASADEAVELSDDDENDETSSNEDHEEAEEKAEKEEVATEAEDVTDDTEDEEDEEEDDEEEEEAAAADAMETDAPSEVNDEAPSWLLEACGDVGLDRPETETVTAAQPLEEGGKKLSLRERLAAVKATQSNARSSSCASADGAGVKRVTFVAEMDEMAALREEVAELRRSSALQAKYIEVLKEKNEALEARLALRSFVDDA